MGGDVTDGFEQPVELEPVLRRGEDHRRVVQEEELLLHPGPELHEHRGPLRAVVAVPGPVAALGDLLLAPFADVGGDEVPFVHDHDAGAPVLGDDGGDLLVLFQDP